MTIPNLKTTRWKYVRRELKAKEINTLDYECEWTIFQAAMKWSKMGLQCRDRNTWKCQVKKGRDPFKWWDDELKQTKANCYKASKRLEMDPSIGTEQLKEARKIHKWLIYCKREDAYHEYVSGLATAKSVAQLCRPSWPYNITGLLTQDGEVVPHTETLNTLLDEHLPESTIIKEVERYKPDKTKYIHK